MAVSTTMSIRDAMTAKLNKIAQAWDRVTRSAEATDRATRSANLGQQYGYATRQINAAGRGVDDFNRRQEDARKNSERIGNGWEGVSRKIKLASAALLAYKTAVALTNLSDQMSGAKARLQLIVDDGGSVEQLQQKIFAAAQASRGSYTDMLDSVAKLGLMAGDAFSSNDEMIKFAELMNKNFIIAGASASEQSNAMYQLNQAMASGRLQGDEYRSIIENAPLLAKSIEDYMRNVVKAKGTMKDWASEGMLTAGVIKNALFSSADEIEERFASMPMTWEQTWTRMKNQAIVMLQPVTEKISAIINSEKFQIFINGLLTGFSYVAQVLAWVLDLIGNVAAFIADNWVIVEPILYGIAAGLTVWAAATAAQTVQQWLLNAALNASPLTWIVLAVAAIVTAIVYWINAVGGLRVAWLVCVNAILTAWDWVKIGFMTGVYWVQDLLAKMQLGFRTAGVAIADFMGQMHADVLSILQDLVNGAINIINGFIGVLNALPFVEISTIDQVTFGTTAQIEAEANRQARANDLAAYKQQIEQGIADRDAALDAMKENARASTAERQANIAAAKAAKASAPDIGGGAAANSAAMQMSDIGDIGNVGKVGEVGKINDDVNIADEDLQFLRDVAEMRFVQNFVTLTPTVAIEAQVNETADMDALATEIERRLEDEFAAAAEGVYA